MVRVGVGKKRGRGLRRWCGGLASAETRLEECFRRKSSSALHAHGVQVGSWPTAGWTGLSSEARLKKDRPLVQTDRIGREHAGERHQERGALMGGFF
jgi:hypothetical protein